MSTPTKNTPPHGRPPETAPIRGVFGSRAAALRADDDAFDALADLFMGEVNAGRRPAQPPAGEPAPARPLLRLTTADEEELDEPLAPPGSPSTADPASPVQAPRPAAAAPRLSDDADEAGRAVPRRGQLPPPARTPVLEVLVLGNLPVLAGAWAGQYVREVAAAAGRPVGYLRVQGDYAGVEIVGDLPEGTIAPQFSDEATLEDALDAGVELTDRWIVRADHGREAPAVASPATRLVTLLTGPDEIARHACAAALKSVAPALAAGTAAPLVRIGVMGTPGEAAAEAGAAMAAAAQALVGAPVQSVVCSPCIGAARPALTLFSGPAAMPLVDALALLERALLPDGSSPSAFHPPAAAEPEPPSRPEPAPNAPPPSAAPDATLPEPAPTRIVQPGEEAAPALLTEITAEPEPLETVAIADPAPRPAPAPARSSFDPVLGIVIGPSLDLDALPLPPGSPVSITAPEAPAPSPTRAPERASADAAAATPAELKPAALGPARPALSSLLPGLAAASARCPYAPAVEFALDDHGALHLLTAADGPAAEDPALAALLVAASWAQAHAPLLAAALGPAVPHARPTLHLFTDRPKRSRRLLETDVRVHLLAPVRLGDDTAWCCMELN